MDTNAAAPTITIEPVGVREYALVMSTGVVRCYVTGTREDAELEASRIMRGIAADAAWYARTAAADAVYCPVCGAPEPGMWAEDGESPTADHWECSTCKSYGDVHANGTLLIERAARIVDGVIGPVE